MVDVKTDNSNININDINIKKDAGEHFIYEYDLTYPEELKEYHMIKLGRVCIYEKDGVRKIAVFANDFYCCPYCFEGNKAVELYIDDMEVQ